MMRRIVSFILHWGAIAAGLLMFGGAAYYFINGSAPALGSHSVVGLWQGLRGGNPLAVIELGMIILLLTPIVAIATIGMNLFRLRDWPTAGIVLGILLIMLLSYALH